MVYFPHLMYEFEAETPPRASLPLYFREEYMDFISAAGIAGYIPHQPYLEFNNRYRAFGLAVGDPLYGIVWGVYQVDPFDPGKTVSVPDGCADIMLFYTPEKMHAFFLSGVPCSKSMDELEFLGDVRIIFGVRFRTGALGNLFKCSLPDAGGGIIALKDIIFGSDLTGRLENARGFEERWGLIRAYLLDRLSKNYEVNVISSYISRSIVESHGQILVKSLEEDTGYSGRYLRRTVNENLGVSIKQLCEITRFQWAYHLYLSSSGRLRLSDLALEAGYYDQSHMNNSCKKLTGYLPRQIMDLYRE